MRISIESNFKDLMNHFDKSSDEIMDVAKKKLTNKTMQITKKAKQNITAMGAVDTGRLRDSIMSKETSDSGSWGSYEREVGTNVEYANYVHDGTRYMMARPFLQQAFDSETADFEKELADYVVKALGGK